MKQTIIWTLALAVGVLLGLVGSPWIDASANFVAAVYTRLFQLLAVPTIVLAVVTTLSQMGRGSGAGRLMRHTVVYTLLTTLAAAAVGALLYVVVSPSSLPSPLPGQPAGEAIGEGLGPEGGYLDHLLSIVPSNVVRPLLEGNVLSLLLMAFAVGTALARMPESEGRTVVVKGLSGLQELLFVLIRALISTLPLAIVAFAAQLSAQLSAGLAAQSIGRYVLVVLGGNVLQMLVVLPLFLLARGINPLRTLRLMSPALLMALFTKSSAATLPVTISTAEQRLGLSSSTTRFVLPICTTINMNGCAAFILVTSLFVMQNGGTPITLPLVLLWTLIAVVSAVGNAGVPMGCFFLTMSLMQGVGAPVAVLSLVLPIYTIIDMVETAENVWSDSCVCAMTDRDLNRH